MAKKVSIIIPAYKSENYIYKCLNALSNQSLSKDNFEVIIVLNGPKEPYYSMIQNYIEKKENFKLIYTAETGVSNARNIGLNNSKYDYILFIDDDDYISENYLEQLLLVADKGKICISNVINFRVEEDKENYSIDFLGTAFQKVISKQTQSVLKFRKFMSVACAKLIDKDIIGDTRFDTDLRKGEDSLFMAQISNNVLLLETLGEDVVYYRRLRNDSASHSKESYCKKIPRLLNLCGKYFKFLFKSDYDKIFIITRILAQLKNLKNNR